MRSMTGYGTGSSDVAEPQLTIQVELTSVNRKSLDLNVSSPKEWNGLEPRCAEWLKGHFERGRIQVQIKVTSADATGGTPLFNERLLEETLERLRSFAKSRQLPFEVDSRLLFSLSQTCKEASGLPDWRELEAPIEAAFRTALTDLNAMRAAEGASLRRDLEARLAEMAALVETIESDARGLTGSYRAKLLSRLSEMGLELDLQDERVLKELALFADRSDISEEMTRLKSHFEQFHGLLKGEQACGRKLDFLCQEIHREFNTTGSKAGSIGITRAVIEGKNTLERVREQVQNIE